MSNTERSPWGVDASDLSKSTGLFPRGTLRFYKWNLPDRSEQNVVPGTLVVRKWVPPPEGLKVFLLRATDYAFRSIC